MAKINARNPGTVIITPNGPRIRTGWQFAPPNVPGAKPLFKHPLNYIIKFIFGGFDAVDKSR